MHTDKLDEYVGQQTNLDSEIVHDYTLTMLSWAEYGIAHSSIVYNGSGFTVWRFALRIVFSPYHILQKHKVLTYIENRAVSGVFRTIDPPPPVHPASVSSPRTKGEGGGGTHSPGGEGVGRSIVRMTPDIGLASPLRTEDMTPRIIYSGESLLVAGSPFNVILNESPWLKRDF